MLCLSCDRSFESRSSSPQCGVCGSRDVISYLQLNEIADKVSKHIDYSGINTLPYLEVMTTVLQTTGIRLRPVNTVKLCTRIHEILQAKWKRDMKSDLSISTDRGRSL